MNNMEKSELVVARILSILMDTGFTESDLSFDDLGLEPEYEAFFDLSVQWLLDEGIIRAREFVKFVGMTGALNAPVLTAYGLSLLNQPSPVGNKETMGKAVKAVSKEGRSYAGIGDFIGGVLGGFTKSMGSG